MGMSPIRRLAGVLAVTLAAGLLATYPSANAQTDPAPVLADSLAAVDALVAKASDSCQLKDAADDETTTDTRKPFVLCDDGLVPSGGGSNGIPVPVAYASNVSGTDAAGLPAPASSAEAAEKTALYDLQPEDPGDRITLDVDVTLPPGAGIAAEYEQPWRSMTTPKGGFPVIVLMHGCCGGHKGSWEAPVIDAENELWHQSNAWFASRGYVVVTYTARGFRNPNDEGSTGTTQLDSRSYEVNDYQYLVGLLADHDAQRRAEGKKPIFNINPRKVAAVGGSYGGGFSWLALTDPTWRSPIEGKSIKLAAAVPRYGWTDLVEALVPSGHYMDHDHETGKTVVAPTTIADAPSRHPIGVEKQSIVSLLYSSGNLMNMNHTTFPAWLHDIYQRLQAGEPYDGDEQIETLVDWFLTDRSAYYQQTFWNRVANGMRVPTFVAATWTDPLFTAMDSGVRFYNKLKSVAPKYPIQMYLGDYQHFVANKAKEWDDLCGDDHHVCTIEDPASSRVRIGVNTRMNRFLDHYLRGKGTTPKRYVWATTTICAANATEAIPADEPGIEYRAGSWRALASTTVRHAWEGGGALTTTTSSTAADNHAAESDPAFRFTQANKCYTTSDVESAPGVVQYEDAVRAPFTLLGMPTVKLTFQPTIDANDYWIAARLFDKDPAGSMTLVTRGICRVNKAAEPDVGCEVFSLWGNAWTFKEGHSIVLEVSQSDVPMFRRDNFPSSLAFEAAELKLPAAREDLRRDFRD
jgi:predicted acyl esterase